MRTRIEKVKKYRKAALKGLEWLAHQLKEDGSYGSSVPDLASYYKSPWLYLIGGRNDLAYRVLGYIKQQFSRTDGDFTTGPGFKTADPALAEYCPYMNTWIAMAAQKLGRFDIAQPAYGFVRKFFHEERGGFTIHSPYNQGDNILDVFITSHLGLACLYFGDIERARRAGDFLLSTFEQQPDRGFGLFLRVDNDGNLITDFPKEQAVFHVVETQEPLQLYFFIGYPIGYLAKLYLASAERTYLEGARAYLNFARSTDERLFNFFCSHKVAWGASVVSRITADSAAEAVATRIGDYLVSIQDGNGGWLLDQPVTTCFDQTAEIALWLFELAAELG